MSSSFQMTFSLVAAAVVWTILDSTSGLDPSSDTIAPRYLTLLDGPMPLVLCVINWVFSALICISICCGGLFKVIYQLDQLLLLSNQAVNVVSKKSVCNGPASNTGCSFMVFKCVSNYCHGRLHWSPCCRGIIWFWSGCN